MTITRIDRDDQITLKLDGWLDTLSSPELGKAVDSIEAASAITLDFENVEYIASSGLRQVIACHRRAKEMGAAFSVINANTETLNIFRMTGIDKKINIQEKQDSNSD